MCRKLNKLYRLKARLYESLRMAKTSGADPEVIVIRTNDLECDIYKVEKEIQFEKLMQPLVFMTWGFAIFSITMLVITIINVYL